MKSRWQIFWHIFFWVVMISLLIFIAQLDEKIPVNQILVLFILYPFINISLFYINYLVLLPKFFHKKQYATYILIIVLIIILFGVGKYGIALIFKEYVLVHTKGHVTGFGQFFVATTFTNLFFLFLSTALKFAIYWFLNERIQRDL